MHRRIAAQIDGINWAAAQLDGLDGDALEMGLGNGRTYDHMREQLPDRRIWVIDRRLKPHPSCIPPEEDFLKGEADAMLEELARRGAKMALTHYEFGIGVDEIDAAEGRRLSPLIAAVMAPGGIVVASQRLPTLEPVRGPESVAEGRYFFYRV
jgi:hypothetical protein